MIDDKLSLQLLEKYAAPAVIHDYSRFVYLNSAAVRKFKAASAAELIGKPILLCVHPDSTVEVKKSLETPLNRETFEMNGLHLQALDGTGFYADIVGTSVIYEGKQCVHLLFNDITQHKYYEENLIRAKEEAEELSRLKSSFLLNMSHELRTPMIGILGFAEVLTEKEDDPETRHLAGHIYSSAKRLMSTINNILEYSKIEAGNFTTRSESFDLVKAIGDVCKQCESQLAHKNLFLNYFSGLTSYECFGDREIFLTVLGHLLQNAVKFTERGGITVSCISEVEDTEHFLVMKVSDTGIGIHQNDLELIFKEFRQASEGIGRDFEGTGLGLTITKAYIEKMGGSIQVNSVLGQGSSFTVRIPGKTGLLITNGEIQLLYTYIPPGL